NTCTHNDFDTIRPSLHTPADLIGATPIRNFTDMTLAGGCFPEILADDFARRFSMRAANLMWFLGAGASAAAGIPTAYDMIWEFKRQLFISQRRVSAKAVADLSGPGTRAQIQAHIDSLG